MKRHLSIMFSKVFLFFIGIGALLWFIIRVIPKPTRAFYPCQRAAFPIAASFVIWLITFISGIFSYFKMKNTRNRVTFFCCGLILIFSFYLSFIGIPSVRLFANSQPEVEIPHMLSFISDTAKWVKPKSEVSIIKRDQTSSDSISEQEILGLVRKAVDMAGGFEETIVKAETIVIKPNLVGKYAYPNGNTELIPESNNGVVTNYRVVRAVVQLIREINDSASIYVLEGSADGGTTRHIMDVFGYNHNNISGVNAFVYLEEVSGEYEEWDSELLQKVILPDNIGLYPNSKKPNKSDEYYLNKLYYTADVVISVPVLKNHSHSCITGAVKNVAIGATPSTIYGGPGDNHRYYQNKIDHEMNSLHKFIHDYYMCRKVDYVVMDGLQGTDYGPVARTPATYESTRKNMNLIIAGKNAVSVDAVAALLMGYNPYKIPHLVYLHNSKAGTIDTREISIKCDDFNIIKSDFKHDYSIFAKYYDFINPKVKIGKVDIDRNRLNFSVSADEDISKIEFYFNGKKHKVDLVYGFDNIKVDLNIEDTITAVKVRVFDKYLNFTDYELY